MVRADRVRLSGMLVADNADVLAPGCVEAADTDDIEVHVLRCESGLTIFAEARAVRSSAAQVSRHPRTVQLDDGALLIVSLDAAFAALTRDAVVSGQGEWIVASRDGVTTAAALSGSVVLRRRADDVAITVGEAAVGPERLRAAWRRWRAGR